MQPHVLFVYICVAEEDLFRRYVQLHMLFAPIRPAFVQALHTHPHVPDTTAFTSVPTIPDITLTQALLRHYHPHLPSSTRVLVGIHARAVRMLLHLAVRTLNECGDEVAEGTKAHATLVMHHSSSHRSVDTTSATPTATTNVHATCTDYATLVTSVEETYPPHHVLLLDLPYIFTQGVWSCAFALFPPHTHHVHAACCELQNELGACVPLHVQRAAAFAFTSPMIQYATNARALVALLTEWVVARFAAATKTRCRSGVSVRAPAPLDSWWCPYTCGVVLMAYSKAHANRLAQRLQQRCGIQSGTMCTKAHEVHIIFAEQRLVNGNAFLAHLSYIRSDHPLLRAFWKHVDAVIADTFK